MLCGSSRNKALKHQYTRSNTKHNDAIADDIDYNVTESSLSNLEEEQHDEDHRHIKELNLNYHGHIANHASPRQLPASSLNPYELIIDQKKLHKIVKAVYYPYLSWQWFDDRFEPVIDVQRRKDDPGPVILRLDGKTYPKCIPCSRENMDRELFGEKTVINMMKWALRHFICYCAEHNHECTYVRKTKQYKKKLQQSIAQSKSLLKAKMKLQQENDALYHQLHDISALKQDLKIYKESSKHWKKECSKEKKTLAELLKTSNTAQMEFEQLELNNTELTEINMEIQNELDTLKDEHRKQIETIETMQIEREKDIETLRNRFNEIQQLNEGLNIELEKLAQENDTISADYNELMLRSQVLGDDMDADADADANTNANTEWNLYDWYNDEQTLQVIDDILSGDADDESIQHFYHSLREQHGYIHEALINNEWNIWKFVQECGTMDDYMDALKKLLDEHPRIYAAIHAEDILRDLEYKEYNCDYNDLMFIEIEDAEDTDDIDDIDDEYEVNDFQIHPYFAIGFACDNIGKLKLFQTKKNDAALMQYCNIRKWGKWDEDHTAYCCAVSRMGEYVAFGGGYRGDTKGIIICYQIKSKHRIELKFVVDDDERQQALTAIHCIAFDENEQLLFVGNAVGDIHIFDIQQNGAFIQTQNIEKKKKKINDLCCYNNHLFVLTDTVCTAHAIAMNGDLQIIPMNTDWNTDGAPFTHVAVAQYEDGEDGEDGAFIVYISSNVLQYQVLTVDAQSNKIVAHNDNKVCAIRDRNEPNPTQITSLHIDHKNEYIVISRHSSIKSYKIGCNDDDNEYCTKTIQQSGSGTQIAKCALNYKYPKYVAICYQKQNFIELKRFLKK